MNDQDDKKRKYGVRIPRAVLPVVEGNTAIDHDVERDAIANENEATVHGEQFPPVNLSAKPKAPPVWSKWPAASSLVSLLGDKRPRLATGFSPIDKAWRGGVKQGLRIAILGAPSAGKTTWASTLR